MAPDMQRWPWQASLTTQACVVWCAAHTHSQTPLGQCRWICRGVWAEGCGARPCGWRWAALGAHHARQAPQSAGALPSLRALLGVAVRAAHAVPPAHLWAQERLLLLLLLLLLLPWGLPKAPACARGCPRPGSDCRNPERVWGHSEHLQGQVHKGLLPPPWGRIRQQVKESKHSHGLRGRPPAGPSGLPRCAAGAVP